MRLNLGSGAFPREGWVNIDLHPYPGVDLVADVAALPYDDGAADEIFAGHVLEHIDKRSAPRVLREWWRVLALGGTLTVVTPDCTVARAWHEAGRLTADELAAILKSSHETPGVAHLAEYDATSLGAILARALPGAALAPVDLAAYPSPPLVSRVGWQCGWVARKGAA